MPTSRGSSFTHYPPYRRRPPKFANSGQLIKFKLPLQQALADTVKEAAVRAVRQRYGDAAATAAGVALDQAIARAIPAANWAVEGEAHVTSTGVRGKASAGFTLPITVAGLNLPEGVPGPQLYARTSFRYSGSLRTGTLKLAMVRADAGFRVA
jgi:hypothetical protein